MQQVARFKAAGTWPAPSFAGGQLWTWGYNTGSGALGLGNTTNYSSPKQVGSLTNWLSITSSFAVDTNQGKAAIKSDGTLWNWGNSTSGMSYFGSAKSSPVQVGTATTWASVSGGQRTFFAIKTNGDMWAWGLNTDGQLGLGNTTAYTYGYKSVGTGWKQVSGGRNITHAIKTNGTLWGWGSNNYGGIGIGNTTNYSSPKQVGALTTWSYLSANRDDSFAIKTDGTLWAWGRNVFGELGLGDSTARSSPVQIGSLTTWSKVSGAAGFSTFAIKTDGTLWSWGRNNYGQLGLGNTTAYNSPKQVGSLTTWSKVSGAFRNTIGIANNGTIWTWGYNSVVYGGLGLNNTTSYSSPIQVGVLTTWAVVSGASGKGQLSALKTP
jgi:hypothetical protein